jgi:hypothetical protein
MLKVVGFNDRKCVKVCPQPNRAIAPTSLKCPNNTGAGNTFHNVDAKRT